MKFKFEFNPFEELGVKVPRGTKAKALEEAKDFIKDAMLSYIADGESPVKGGHWRKKLSPDYKNLKEGESSSNFANLELTGEFLDSLEFKVKGNRIVVEVPKSQRKKAEGHLTGQYGSGQMKEDYRREFMPTNDEELRPDILRGVKKILEEYGD